MVERKHKNVLDSYKEYRLLGGSSHIKRKRFCTLVNGFNKHIMKLVCEGETVKLPEKMGSIQIIGKKIITEYDEELGRITNQAIDYGETNKLWARCPECKEKKQMVYHLNEHTNNIRYRVFWSREKIMTKLKLFYTMIPTRGNKRAIAKLIKSGKEYYVKPIKLKL